MIKFIVLAVLIILASALASRSQNITGANSSGVINFPSGALSATSPTFVTPVLGTPSSGNAANLTGYAYPETVTGCVSGAALYGSATTTVACGGILNTNILTKGGGAGAAPTNTSITDDGKNITSSEVAVLGNKVNLTGDFTDSTSGSLVPVTGLSYTLPTSKAVNVSFHCMLLFDQGTAAVVDEFGIGVTGTAPTQANATAFVWANASHAWTATGVLTALASTTPTLVVSFTPSAITTVWSATLDGTIEQPSNATPGVFSVYAFTTTGGDNLIVKRGSYCSLF